MGLRPTTFSSLYEQYKPGIGGWGKSEHLRGAPLSDKAGAPVRLYTHGALAISRSGEQAMRERAGKWQAGSAGVRQAIDREYGPGMGERVFARIVAKGGPNLHGELRRGDLGLIRATIQELRSAGQVLAGVPELRRYSWGGDHTRAATQAMANALSGLARDRIAEARQRHGGPGGETAALQALRREVQEATSSDPRLQERALSLVDLEIAQLRVEQELVLGRQHLSPEQAWRLVMDGHAQAARGRLGYENEMGYMQGGLNGVGRMLESVRKGERMTADLFCAFHDTCISGVRRRDWIEPDPMMAGDDGLMTRGFRDGGPGVHFGLGQVDPTTAPRPLQGNTTAAGLAELRVRADADPQWFRIEGGAGGYQSLRCMPQTAAACEARVERILDAYYTEAATARTDADKIRAIARCCQNLDQSHVFSDGNIRTVAFLVMNKLLIEAGLSPAILDDPNCFDCFSVDELVAEIQRGQAVYAGHATPPGGEI